MNLTSEAAWRPHVMHAWRHADIQRLQTPQEAGGHDTLPPRRPGPPQATRTRTRRETHGRCSAEPQSSWCLCVREVKKLAEPPARPDLWLEMGNKGKAAGWSGRPPARTDAPAAPLRIQRPAQPARPVRRVESISSRRESQSLRHDHERRGRPERRDGARGRPYVGEWGSRVAAQCVGRV